MKFRLSSGLSFIWICSVCLSASGVVSHAANIEVTSAEDDGSGGLTLREAIDIANSNSESDVITFAPGLNGEEIELIGGALQITEENFKTTIDASALAGGILLQGDTGSRQRVFEVDLDAELELINLVITGGRAPHGGNGMDGATADDGEDGGNGGGIYNEGVLTLDRCEVFFNRAGDGGDAGELDADSGFAGAGGIGGLGGGIYSDGEDASLTLIDSMVTVNYAGNGGTGGGVASGRTGNANAGGKGGSGGGVYCIRGNLTLVRTVLDGNEAGDGGIGGYDGDDGTGQSGGEGGDGGGIAVVEIDPVVQDCEFVANYAGNGGGGGRVSVVSADVQGKGGDGGNGGGMFISIQSLAGGAEIERTLFYANIAGNGAKGGTAEGSVAGDGTDGGFGGFGGGLFATSLSSSGSPVLTIENSTFYQNTAGNGGGGGIGSGSNTGGIGGDAGGGGGIGFDLINVNYTALLSHLTMIGNKGGNAGAGDAGTDGEDGFESEGGGVWTSLPAGLTLANCVVAANIATTNSNVGGFFTSEGSNLTSGDPLLGSLQDNGGDTRTLMPQTLSPLIDGGGTLSSPLLTDQRGEARPKNGAPDLGAVEVGLQVDAKIGNKSNPAAQKIDNFYSATGAGQVLRVKLSGRRKSKFHFSLQNDGEIDDQLLLYGSKANKTLRLKAFQLTGGRVNVTGAMRAGYSLGAVNPGATVVFQGQVKARSSKKRARQNLTFQGRSVSAASVDGVKAKVKQSKR